MKQLNKISIFLTFILTMFISSSAIASPLKAEISCELFGNYGNQGILYCVDEIKIRKNNITKSYTPEDMYSSYVEGMENCNTLTIPSCTFDLTEHFEVRVWHDKTDHTKLILKILLNNEVIWQDETSAKYRWLGIKN